MTTRTGASGSVLLDQTEPLIHEMRYRPDAFSEYNGRERSFAQFRYLTQLTPLTHPRSPAKLSSVFTPRWISRKASSGVLFFWGGNSAS
jgi:hypothetical protein